jgi:hypothetical protein
MSATVPAQVLPWHMPMPLRVSFLISLTVRALEDFTHWRIWPNVTPSQRQIMTSSSNVVALVVLHIGFCPRGSPRFEEGFVQ